MNLKPKALISLAIILLSVNIAVGYGIYGSDLIIDKSSQVENISYPSLNDATKLVEIVKKTKATILTAIYEEDEDLLLEVEEYSQEFTSIIEKLQALDHDKNLTETHKRYQEYQKNGVDVVTRYIVDGADDNIVQRGQKIATDATSINADIETYRLKKFADFSSALGEMRKQSKRFQSVFIALGVFLVVLVMLIMIQTNRVFKRIHNLVGVAKILGRGDLDNCISNTATDEIGVLSNTFEIMRISIKDHISNLDSKVEQRTKQLEASKKEVTNILNSIEQGIFTFNPDLSVNESHSLKAEEIFNTTSFKETNISKLMGASEKDLENLSQWTSMVTSLLFADRQWKKYARLAPIQEITEIIDGEEHIIKMDYKLIRETEGESKIMVLASDITEKRRAEKELAKSEKENALSTSRVMALIGHDNDEISEFLECTDAMLKAMKPLEPNDVMKHKVRLFREAHTQKGHGGTLGFEELAYRLGLIENFLSHITVDEVDQDVEEHTGSWCDSVTYTLAELDKIFELKRKIRSENDSSLLAIDKDLYAHLLHISWDPAKLNAEKVSKAIIALKSKKFGDYSRKYRKLIDTYVRTSKKDIEPLGVVGGDEFLHTDVIRSVDDAIVHLVRNAMDHGIEANSVREEQGKDKGKVSIEYAFSEGWHRFGVRDNGAGLDPKMIGSKAVEKNIISADELSQLSEQETIDLIFHAGFTTKDSVSSISGRGVGMDAVRSIAVKLGGDITVDSRIGEGTLFSLRIPA